MNKLTTNNLQMRLDFEVLPTAAITLNTAQIIHAVEISSRIKNLSKQWQVYLYALALIAFEEWISERSDVLSVNSEKSTLFQPGLATAIAAIANLEVGKFKLCLLTTDSLTDNQVILPRVVVDLPDYVPHFYVLVEVLEEQDAANILGVLPYQQLIEHQLTAN